jgi:hypothetical protein
MAHWAYPFFAIRNTSGGVVVRSLFGVGSSVGHEGICQ